jgi:hypothetical protein
MTELLPLISGPRAVPHRDAEFDFLCALAGADPSPERVRVIANWNLSPIDWSPFFRLAEHHGVLPLAVRNLIEHSRSLPPEIERSLRSAYEEKLRRSLWFAAELARIMRHFERRELRALPYKGPVLAQSVYRDLGLRSFSDLDFLIAPADFERAKLALAEIGYRPSTNISAAVERLWLRTGYERSFDGAAGKYLVELQWALLPRFYAVDLRVEDLLARAGRIVVGDNEMSSLSPEDSLLVLCVHAAKHLWTRLIWLADIAATLRSYPGIPGSGTPPSGTPPSGTPPSGTPPIDYPLAFSRARALGIARILGISFWLAKNVLHAELPKPAEEMIAADPQTRALGGEFAERLARSASYDFESTEYFRLILKLRERRAERWRYLWRLVCTPNVGDVAVLCLPEALFPLYRIVRMGRLIRKSLL